MPRCTSFFSASRSLLHTYPPSAASCGVVRLGSELLALVDVSNEVERAQTRELASAAGTPDPEPVTIPAVAEGMDDKAPSSSDLSAETSEARSNGAAGCRRCPPPPSQRDDDGGGGGGGSGADGGRLSQLPRRVCDAGDGGGGCAAVENGALPQTRVRQQRQQQQQQPLTEPFVAWCVSRDMDPSAGLFLSASMPCRDVEAFADSGLEDGDIQTRRVGGEADAGGVSEGGHHGSGGRLSDVASNRGASGIDGVVSSAMGYAAGLRAAVTLVIGDMATLHDLGSLHALTGGGLDAACCPVTVVCVNNGGEFKR